MLFCFQDFNTLWQGFQLTLFLKGKPVGPFTLLAYRFSLRRNFLRNIFLFNFALALPIVIPTNILIDPPFLFKHKGTGYYIIEKGSVMADEEECALIV